MYIFSLLHAPYIGHVPMYVRTLILKIYNTRNINYIFLILAVYQNAASYYVFDDEHVHHYFTYIFICLKNSEFAKYSKQNYINKFNLAREYQMHYHLTHTCLR